MMGAIKTSGLLRSVAKLSVSYAALACATAHAQTAGATRQAQAGSQLPPISITAPEAQHRAHSAPGRRADRGAQRRHSRVARRPEPQVAPTAAFAETQDTRTGTVGVYANSTSVATKTNTPLLNIPQSLTVLTKEYIRDQNFQSLTDVTRYVPGVAIHQGEGNRDELVIRSLQRAKHRDPQGAERADLRPRRRRRPGQSHAEGSRRRQSG
jgi:catecholate siderophore receptor